MRPLQADELAACFQLAEGEALSLPPLDSLRWDALDFLGWCNRTGDKAFLAVETGGALVGLALDRMNVGPSKARSFMCSICHTMHGPRGIANFTYHVRRDPRHHTLTDLFCGDLRCSLYVRGLLSSDVSQFYETITIDRKVERLRAGLDRYLGAVAAFETPRRARLRVV